MFRVFQLDFFVLGFITLEKRRHGSVLWVIVLMVWKCFVLAHSGPAVSDCLLVINFTKAIAKSSCSSTNGRFWPDGRPPGALKMG